MDGLNFDSILDESQVNELFGGEPEVEEPTSTPTEQPEDLEEENITEEDDSLFGKKQPESVGNDDSQEQEGVPPTGAGTSPSEFFSSIAEAFVEEGIFPDLDEETISKINSPEALRDAITAQIQAGLTEEQQRVSNALKYNVEPSQIAWYENTLSQLDEITEDFLRDDKNEQSANVRRTLLLRDYLNRGFSEARAKKAIDRAFENGTDVDDAVEALESCKEFYTNGYNTLIEEAEQAEKKAAKEREAQNQKLRKTILEDDIKFFGDMEIDKKTRQKAYDAIMKPVYKDKETGRVLTALGKLEQEDREGFLAKIGLLYALTDEFKNLDKVLKSKVKKEVNKGFSALEKKLNNSRIPTGGTLKFMSGNSSSSNIPFDGRDVKLTF